MGTAPPMLGFLQPPYQPRPRTPTPAHLLVARYGYVPFLGREAELADLDAWSADPAPVRVRLITGPGGAGKTRLVAEWLERQQQQGRRVGFWKGDITEAGVTALLQAQRVTVAVDYAETRAGLALLLDRLAEVQAGQIRVVLLARHTADWWTGLKARSTEVDALLSDTMEWEIGSVPLAARQAIFDAAVNALAAHRERSRSTVQSGRSLTALVRNLYLYMVAWVRALLGAVKPALSQPPKRTHPTVQTDLSDPIFARTLYLHMAALAVVEGLPLAADTLVQGILDHEARAWMHRAGLENAVVSTQQEEKEQIRRAVAALTLLGGVEHGQQVLHLLERLKDENPKKRRSQLKDLYPDPDGRRLTGLEPDLLGEALVAQVIHAPDQAAFLDAVVGDATHAGLVHTFSVLGRLEARAHTDTEAACTHLLSTDLNTRVVPAFEAVLALGEKTAFAGLAQVLTAVLKDRGTDDMARALDRRVPYPSVMLSGVGAWMEQRLMPPKGLEENQEERAKRLVNYGRWLSALGDREGALAATREAVELQRRLMATRPDGFLPDLALSLNNLGSDLSDLGDREGALAATREAVALRRILVASHPDAFLPDLATSLNNLGKMLFDLDAREGALAATREAVALRRILVASRPETFLPDLAASLNNLGSMLSALGDREGALAATREAVELRRRLVASRPDAFLPDLARSLHNLGNRLYALEDWTGALTVTREAVELNKRLVKSRPDAFLPDLAGSLNNLGNMLYALGNQEGALAAIREAVEKYRCLVATRPDTFLLDLARALNNLGVMMSELGDREGALAATREAVELNRRLMATRPDVLPNLAMSLNNLGNDLSDLGDREGALAAIREAIAIYTTLAQKYPARFTSDLKRVQGLLSRIERT